MKNHTELVLAEANHIAEEYSPFQAFKLLIKAYRNKPKNSYSLLLLAIKKEQEKHKEKAEAERFRNAVKSSLFAKHIINMLDEGGTDNAKQK